MARMYFKKFWQSFGQSVSLSVNRATAGNATVVAEASNSSGSEPDGGADGSGEPDTSASPAGEVTGAASASTQAAVHHGLQPDAPRIAARHRPVKAVPPKRARHGPGTYRFDEVEEAG